MSFVRIGSRLANGSRSGVYAYSDGEYVQLQLAENSASRRRSGTSIRLTHEELIAIAKSCQQRGWLDAPATPFAAAVQVSRDESPEA